MKLLDNITRRFPAPRLTATRVTLALAVALAADAVQVLLLPLGPVGFVTDEVIDVIAMVITCWLLGFHVLLLPTFVIEFIPGVGVLPTWSACVIAVVAMRRAAQKSQPAPPVVTVLPATGPAQLPAPPIATPPRPERADAKDGVDANPS